MDKYKKSTKTLGNIEKIADFVQKNAKFRDIEMLKTNITKNYAVLYYQNTKDIFWTLKLEKTQKTTKIFKKLEKNCKN